jgi:hypothetical protein
VEDREVLADEGSQGWGLGQGHSRVHRELNLIKN